MATMNGQDAGMADAHISSLRDLLSGTTAHVLTPSDNGYEKSIERWSRAAEKPAGVCIVPTSTAEVATAVKYATTNHLDIAVKGGGHSTSGASSTHGGILIDLGRMRNVRVDEQNQLLYVQGGALWSDVDAAAWEYGLATVGGTVADTGVGGLTLGGGYGVLSGLYGLVIDNLVGATVVLASGEVKHASRDENPDLLWALQGAGQNFGVTTEFVLQAYPQKETYQGTMLFPCTPANISAVVSFMNDLFAVHQADTSSTTSPGTKTAGRALVLFGLAKPAPMDYQTVLLVNAHYAGSKADGLACYQPLLDLNPIMNTMGDGALSERQQARPRRHRHAQQHEGRRLRAADPRGLRHGYDRLVRRLPLVMPGRGGQHYRVGAVRSARSGGERDGRVCESRLAFEQFGYAHVAADRQRRAVQAVGARAESAVQGRTRAGWGAHEQGRRGRCERQRTQGRRHALRELRCKFGSRTPL